MTIDIDERKLARNEFGMWIGWTLATTAGMLVGFLPLILLVDTIDLLLMRLLTPLWAGFLVGALQWLVLRNYLTHSADWVVNEGAGFALGFALGLLAIEALSRTLLGALVGYILFGAIIALVQWPVLRREIPNALPWVAANIVGWALGAYLSQVVLDLVTSGGLISQVVSTGVTAGVTGLVAGAVTGLALIWIVRQPDIEDLRA